MECRGRGELDELNTQLEVTICDLKFNNINYGKESGQKNILPDEVIINKIYLIREQKVLMDKNLAEMYGVDTKVLKQAVKQLLNAAEPKRRMIGFNRKDDE